MKVYTHLDSIHGRKIKTKNWSSDLDFLMEAQKDNVDWQNLLCYHLPKLFDLRCKSSIVNTPILFFLFSFPLLRRILYKMEWDYYMYGYISSMPWKSGNYWPPRFLFFHFYLFFWFSWTAFVTRPNWAPERPITCYRYWGRSLLLSIISFFISYIRCNLIKKEKLDKRKYRNEMQ